MGLRVRAVKSGDRGNYYQLVESRRVDGKPRQIVHVHLGEHPTVDNALEAWPGRVDRLRSIGRDEQADKLQDKLDRLRELVLGIGA